MRHLPVFGIIAALGLTHSAGTARVGRADDPPAQAANPAQPPIVIGGNGGQQITIIVGPGGQLLLAPAPNINLNIELPIVNNGFATDADVRGPIAPLIRALEAASYQDRQAASEALLRLPPGRLPEIIAALKSETDEEALSRLTEVAEHLYLKPRTYLKARPSLLGILFTGNDPSLLGIKFQLDRLRLNSSDAGETVTIMVTQVQPGFPAMQTLRAGDRIVAIAGESFPADMDELGFRSRIAALWPGVVVPMQVLREGKVVELGVQTTSVPLNGAPLQEEVLNNLISNMVMQRSAALEAFMESLQKYKPGGVQ